MTGRGAGPVLEDTVVEQLLTRRPGPADPDLRRAVARVRAMADGPAPPPNAALADLLDRGFDPTVVPFRRPTRRRRRWAERTGAGLVAAAASVVVAGTAAALPAPLQDTVADLVSALTPFELPRPAAQDQPDRTGADDDTAPSGTPEPAVAPTPSAASPSAATTGGPARTTSRSVERQRPADAPGLSGTTAREQREQQRAADDAAEQSQRAEEDAADEAEDAAEDAEREQEDAADDAADEAEDAAEDAEREQEDAADDAADEAEADGRPVDD